MRTSHPGPEAGRRTSPLPDRSLPLALLLLLAPLPAMAQAPLTLSEALAEARAHNATLPVAAYDTAMAAAALGAARGRLGPTLGVDGDVHGGVPSHYASDDARLQLVGDLPIYDGGRLRASVRQAQAAQAVSAARFRVARRDLDFQVTAVYSQAIELEDELALGVRGLDRLRRYQELIAARRESGQPVAGDLLKAQVELDRAAADTAETHRQLAGADLQLCELLGRAPADSLDLAPLPPPAPPGPAGGEPWAATPDLAAAAAATRSAQSAIAVVQADRRPHLDLAANVGAEPVLGSSFAAPFNTGRGAGAEVLVSFSWPLWDRGVYRSDLEGAQLALAQSTQQETAARIAARSAWSQARADLEHLYAVVRLREATVPAAEDAYLETESLYRGGAADALEVLDAYAQWLQAGLDAAGARLAYRLAEARERRWGGDTP